MFLLGSPAPAAADACTEDTQCGFNACRTPAFGAPLQLWGELAPVDTQIPGARDNSDYNFQHPPVGHSHNQPRWMSLDVESEAGTGSTVQSRWIFAAITHGLQVWDATGAKAADPERVAAVGQSAFPAWPTDTHQFLPVQDVDAPPGNPNVVAVVVADEGGLAVFNTASKSQPLAVYGDRNKQATAVYAARINGVDYSFLATQGKGILVHNLTNAGNRTSLCVEESPATTCPGIYVGRLGLPAVYRHVDGTGNFVVASPGTLGGVKIWNVSNPQSPQQVMNALTSEFVEGVALWRSGSNYYLGTRVLGGGGSPTQARIYDVTCISTGGCSSLGAPIWTQGLPNNGTHLVTYSESAGRKFLYFGHTSACNQGQQAEWLFDVTTPASAFDITPSAASVGGVLTGYWGWYYRKNPTGFNDVSPRMGKFAGNYFYRAAFSIFDIHELTGPTPPVAAFTYSPSTVYQGQPVAFFDQSGGLPSSWLWTFQDATPPNSALQNPSGVVFNSTGAKTVSLTATNGSGQDSTNQLVQVLDPVPQIGGVTAAPTSALVCQPITFTAQNVTGFPNPTLAWEVEESPGGSPVANGGNVNPFVWSTVGVAPGTYTATATATNSAGSGSKTSPVVTLLALPALQVDTPTNDAFTHGTVQFHVTGQGITEWNWDFGLGFTGFTNDPVAGPNPVHNYDEADVDAVCGGSLPCTFDVRVQVRNCVTGPVESAVLEVTVTQLQPLVANFHAQGICFSAGCFANVGQAVTFVDQSSGDPDLWDYDWNGDGTFEDAGNTSPVTSHTYNSVGLFSPKLRVRRGLSEQVTVTHVPAISVSSAGPPPPPPSITISGPTSGDPGQTLSFTATANNCTPSPTGWSWTASGGGSFSGPTNGSQVSVSWAATGSKTLTASNSGCPTAPADSHSVNVTDDPDPGPGNLTAEFSFSPASPEQGQAVSFDASASTGSPATYNWNFGDGSNGSGKTASHAYAQPGSYQVTLTVGKTSSSCPFGFCSAEKKKTVAVTGGDPPLSATFDTDAECGAFSCTAEVGQQIGFTSTSQGATGHQWDFGDGDTASGKNVQHTWDAAGTYAVILKVTNGKAEEAETSKLFEVTGAPEPLTSTVVLPWIAATTGALVQTSDLYVTNPTDEPMEVTITFRTRGTPDPTPPQAGPLPVAPHQTLHFPDALGELFGLGDAGGFLVITAEDVSADPVVGSLNRTRQADGATYGQMIPGVTLGELDQAADAGGGKQYLLGLTDSVERHSYFGITNPHDQRAVYTLTFFDQFGEPITGPSEQLVVARWGQKQFQIEELRELFDLEDHEDYRVEITQVSGGTLFPYAGVVRQGTQDPSFVRVSVPNLQRIYLVGAASTPGFNRAFFQTDAVLGNPTDQVMEVDVTYLNVGLGNEPEPTQTLALQPMESRRIRDVLHFFWSITNSVGVLTFESSGAGGLFPMIHGETYQNSGPQTQFGLFMPARRDAEAARAGQKVVFTGLRQNGEANTTLWLFNPSADEFGSYDVVYRALDGTQLGRVDDYRVGAGAIRQINPGALQLPPGGVEGGFAVEIVVHRGQLIAGANVVINQSNDPAYVAGVVR